MSAAAPSADELARRERQRAAQAEARRRQASGAPTKKERKKRKKQPDAAAPSPKRAAAPAPKQGSEGAAKWRQKEFKGKGRNEFRKARDPELEEEAKGRTGGRAEISEKSYFSCLHGISTSWPRRRRDPPLRTTSAE